MERKNYSRKKPIRRQTLWSQKQKGEHHYTLGDRLEENPTQATCESPLNVECSYEGASSSDEVDVDSTIALEYEDLGDIHLPTSEPAEDPMANVIPIFPPQEDSESDHNLSSEEDDTVNYGIPENDLFITMDSDLDSSEDDDYSISETDADTAGYSLSKSSAARPEAKYPLLVHLLRSKHKLTKEATDDVLEILNDFSNTCLDKPILPKDARTLGKMYEPYLSDVEKHFFCKQCGLYVGRWEKKERYVCRFCKSSHLFKDSEFFYYMPLSSQLRQIFENNYDDVALALNCEIQTGGTSHHISSVMDGAKYQEYQQALNKESQHISLSFSCDDVPGFDSSKSSLSPVTCTINELPMSLRKKHVLMPALWYGVNKKPDMNQYLQPFVEEAILLRERGFTYYKDGIEQVCKVTVLKGIADSVARPKLLNSTQFNGEYGCTECYHPGEQVPKGRGTVRVYRLRNVERRTSEETLQLATEASVQHKPVKGIKGKTILSFIPSFNVIDGLVPDYMHASILGTVRQFSKLWFDSKYHTEEFYIGGQKEDVNKRLALQKPPFYFSRPPRAIDEIKFWKGHEFFIWGLIYSVVVLKGILPKKFLIHWMLFVEGLFLLLQESILKSQVYNAIDFLAQFTKGTEELYGRAYCSFNLHLQEHLGKSVFNWGPLWEHSAFLYEDYYQVLLKAIHSSKGVLEQVIKQIRTIRSIPSLLSTPVGSSLNHLKVVKKDRLLSTQNSVVCSNADSESVVLSPVLDEIQDEVRLAFASINILLKKMNRFTFLVVSL